MAVGKLLVIGATSSTGQLIVKRGIEPGWIASVLGRRTLPEQASNAAIQVRAGPNFEGSIDDETLLTTASRGQDAIISVVGPSRPPASATIFVPAYKRILSVMKTEGTHRIISLSTFSVYDPNDKATLARWCLTTLMWAMAHRVWKAIVDIAGVFEADGGDLDWTLFRVGFLRDGAAGEAVDGYVGDGIVGLSVKRADVAEWPLE
ncbi:hypothetical protein KVR01_008916 [Diaporthe batatas]|uniref:uncharacterized protein n=1 Tax=Diaporthe batatas TaxID=748121 RepID=UPI001D057485|nr:uncharacterized protein KVR01_008916 [Diaporthe batatas]KAG8160652.1 hypothetical protein KVR01_008916 [Diaporthe batatas]